MAVRWRPISTRARRRRNKEVARQTATEAWHSHQGPPGYLHIKIILDTYHIQFY